MTTRRASPVMSVRSRCGRSAEATRPTPDVEAAGLPAAGRLCAVAENFNLTLEKWSSPYNCFDGGAELVVQFTIRVENTGDVPYWGPITVSDHLPANNPGATMSFWPTPPWSCGPTGPTADECTTRPRAAVPRRRRDAARGRQAAQGAGGLLPSRSTWPAFSGRSGSMTTIRATISMWASPASLHRVACRRAAGHRSRCSTRSRRPNCFDPAVAPTTFAPTSSSSPNAGPGNYTGPIQVKDTLGVNAPADVFGPWTCGQAGPVLTCNINAAPVNVPPGWSSVFFVQAKMPKPVGPPLCDLNNKAKISHPRWVERRTTSCRQRLRHGSDAYPDPGVSCAGGGHRYRGQEDRGRLRLVRFVYYCQWTITITNVGPDHYVGPLTFTDTGDRRGQQQSARDHRRRSAPDRRAT